MAAAMERQQQKRSRNEDEPAVWQGRKQRR